MQTASMLVENNRISYQEGHVQIHLNVIAQTVKMEIVLEIR